MHSYTHITASDARCVRLCLLYGVRCIHIMCYTCIYIVIYVYSLLFLYNNNVYLVCIMYILCYTIDKRTGEYHEHTRT